MRYNIQHFFICTRISNLHSGFVSVYFCSEGLIDGIDQLWLRDQRAYQSESYMFREFRYPLMLPAGTQQGWQGKAGAFYVIL